MTSHATASTGRTRPGNPRRPRRRRHHLPPRRHHQRHRPRLPGRRRHRPCPGGAGRRASPSSTGPTPCGSVRRSAKPGAVLCIGQNYAAHAAESGDAPPEIPIMFFKHPNTVVGPYDDVYMPPGAEKVDWEVELAVVIGKRARYLASPDDALACVAGYAVSNDVSERDYQSRSVRRSVVQGQMLRDLQPARPVARPRRRDRRPATAAPVLASQRRSAAGLHHRRHDLLGRAT